MRGRNERVLGVLPSDPQATVNRVEITFRMHRTNNYPNRGYIICAGCNGRFPNRAIFMNHCKYDEACTAEMRFWGKVNKDGHGGCWVWLGYRQKFGHGWLGDDYGLAHRYAWKIAGHGLRDEDCLLHKCDNPPCVNPAHLFVGDRVANSADSVAKDRHARGERNRWATMTEAQVLELLARATGKRGEQTRFAREYGTTPAVIGNILRGKTWRHLKRIELPQKDSL